MDTTNNTSNVHADSESNDLVQSMYSGEVVFERFKITGILAQKGAQKGDLTIYSATDLSNNSPVIIKCLESEKESLRLNFIDFNKSKALNHPNITQYKEFHTSDNGFPAFVVNIENQVNLKDIISSSGPIEQEEQIFFVLQNICKALEHAHKHDTYHGGIKPEDISLGSKEDNQVAILVDNFRFDLQAILMEKNLGVSIDVTCIAAIAYYIVTGIEYSEFVDIDTLDHIPTIKNLDEIREIRPDLLCLDEFVQLIEDATTSDLNQKIDTVEELENGLLDWMEAVKATSRSADSSVLAKAQKSSDKRSIDTPTTKDLSSVVKHITELRKKQSDQEESIVIKLTDIASSGARSSPTTAVSRVVLLVCAWAVIISGIAYLWIIYPNEIETAWKNTSKNIYLVIKPKEEDTDLVEMTNLQIKAKKTTKNKEQLIRHKKQTNDHRGRKNLLPPFNPAKLSSIYHGKIGLTNNTNGKNPRFRIEYREFREEWIK